MAISSVHFSIVRELYRRQILTQNGTLLTLGEAHWGNDVDPRALAAEIPMHVGDLARQTELLASLNAALSLPSVEQKIAVAKIFHEMFFAPRQVLTIDSSASASALQYDLNEPLAIERRFDVVINYGATERTFDIAQVFITMHDRTAPGGLMMHQCAFNSWSEHLYYSVQPTLFFDLAEANGYRLHAIFIEDVVGQRALRLFSRETIIELVRNGQVPANTTLFAALVKGLQDRPFQIPMQGYYFGKLSDAGMHAWRELR